MGSTTKRMILVVAAAALFAMPAFADSYTTSASFATTISGMTPTTANFDTDTPGNIAEGQTVDGIQFNYSIAGGTDSLAIVSSLDYFQTTSDPNYLGSNDPGTAALFGGDSITMTFASPVNAVGLFIISGGPYDADEFTLASSTASAMNSTTLEETLSDGGEVIFLGISSTSTFNSAELSLAASAGQLTWNVDDVTTAAGSGTTPPPPMPEPGSLVLLGIGAALCGCGVLRKQASTAAPRAGILR